MDDFDVKRLPRCFALGSVQNAKLGFAPGTDTAHHVAMAAFSFVNSRDVQNVTSSSGIASPASAAPSRSPRCLPTLREIDVVSPLDACPIASRRLRT